MSKKIYDSKREMAYLYFMQGLLQKEICEKVGISAVSLKKWKEAGMWEEKRSANNITRPELVNKMLKSINVLLDEAISNKKEVNTDSLAKLASAIERLDKKNNVINDIETFTNFNTWLQSRIAIDNDLTTTLIKDINKFQDLFIHERLNK